MWIMTAQGWKQLQPKHVQAPGHTPSMLERMGIDLKYNGIKAMAEYCNSKGIGVYFTFYPDGTALQTRPAVNPIEGMF